VYGTTPKGRRLARRLIQRALQRQRAVLEGLSEAERGQLAALLARMQQNANRMKDAAVATTL
jgi:DNA-binding MarR family transcriptional regulator